MKFATKLALLFSGIYLLSGVILVSYIYTSNIRILEDQIKTNLEDQAFHTMDKIDRVLFEKYADLKLLSTDSVLKSIYSTPQQITDKLKTFLDNYTTYVYLSFFDINRVKIADTSGLDIGEKDSSMSIWNHLHEDSAFSMDVLPYRPPYKVLFRFAAAVKDEKGLPCGVIVSKVLPQSELYQITNLMAGALHEGAQELKVELVDREGRILYSNYRPDDVLRMVSSDAAYLKKVLSSERGAYIGRDDSLGPEDEIHVFAREQGYLNFPGNGWTLLMSFPKKLAFGPAGELRDKMIVVLLSVGAITIAMLFALARSITKPIAQLSNASIAVAQGNLDITVDINSETEVGQLGASFNKMVTDLKTYRERLLGYSRELETEVAGRTALLKATNEQLITYQEDLRSLASQLALAEEGERRRIAADLHDQIGQKMALTMIKLDLLRGLADSTKLAEPLDQVCELMEETIQDMRSLTYRISSPILYEMGLESALEWLAEETRKRHKLNCTFERDKKPKPLDDDVSAILFRSVNELLMNVVKHARAKSLRISVRKAEENIFIEVKDNGIGFDASKAGLHSSHTGGFGLFSIRERLNSVGGHFEIESRRGRGTRVALVAPFKKQPPAEEKSQEYGAELRDTNGEGIKILIVDDHEMVRDGLRVLLEMEPEMQVIAEAENGRMAVQLTRELSPDVVVMDVSMPDLGGIEATQQIVENNPEVKVIALSMHSNERFVSGMLEAGAHGYVLKDSAFGELAQAIRAVVANQEYVSPKVRRLVTPAGNSRRVRARKKT